MPYSDPVAQREYQRRWQAQRYAKALAALGGECAWCRATEDLQIDHVRPVTKDPAIIGKRAFMPTWPWSRILAELAKCWLLCRECHRVKTRDDLPDLQHGHSRYVKRGCRCDECKAGHAAINKAWRHNRGC